MIDSENKVLLSSYSPSTNFFESDLMFNHYFKSKFSKKAQKYIEPKLSFIGNKAAGELSELAFKADKNPPQLIKRNYLGETINHIEFHPSYNKMLEIAIQSELFYSKWNPEMIKNYAGELNHMSFGISYFFAMAECGLFCPLCMTDGVATLVDKFCTKEDKDRILPKIYSKNIEDLYTGAMFLTEKRGGSDVGRNIVKATPIKGKEKLYHLNGEKWFCSNATAEVIFVLARTDSKIEGTKGLSIFLVEKSLQQDSNALNYIRLKDKLGVKSMASAEIDLTNVIGKLVGEEFNGFKIMSEMMNISRIYNSIAALSVSRRALIETYQFLSHRETFNKVVLNHALIRVKLEEIGALNSANFYLNWRGIEVLDSEDAAEKELLRFLTPMLKKSASEIGVYITRESMELMGGIGYIEDGIMPRLMRDVMVLPIWEGAGNIMTLDMLRASFKSDGMLLMLNEVECELKKSELHGALIKKKLDNLVKLKEELATSTDRDLIEASYGDLFSQLTTLYQMALMIRNRDEVSKNWIDPALNYFAKKLKQENIGLHYPISKEEIINLIAWK